MVSTAAWLISLQGFASAALHYVPPLLVGFLLCILWVHRKEWKARAKEIKGAKEQVLVEVGLIGFMTHQATRLLVVGGAVGHAHPIPQIVHTGQSALRQSASGQNLTVALHDLWQSLLGPYLPWVAALICCLSFLGLVGLMEGRAPIRAAFGFGAFLWTIYASFKLTVHDPEHLSGIIPGLFVFAAFVVTRHSLAEWAAENEDLSGQLLSAMKPWLDFIPRRAPQGERHHPRRASTL